MPTDPDDADDTDDLASILAEEEPNPPTEEAIQAVLADPTFAGIVARATRRLPGLLTEKALDHTRRTLAILFLTNPHAASLLAGAQEIGGSAAQPTAGAPPVKTRSAK